MTRSGSRSCSRREARASRRARSRRHAARRLLAPFVRPEGSRRTAEVVYCGRAGSCYRRASRCELRDGDGDAADPQPLGLRLFDPRLGRSRARANRTGPRRDRAGLRRDLRPATAASGPACRGRSLCGAPHSRRLLKPADPSARDRAPGSRGQQSERFDADQHLPERHGDPGRDVAAFLATRGRKVLVVAEAGPPLPADRREGTHEDAAPDGHSLPVAASVDECPSRRR